MTIVTNSICAYHAFLLDAMPRTMNAMPAEFLSGGSGIPEQNTALKYKSAMPMHERLQTWFVLGERRCLIHSAIHASAHRIGPRCAQYVRQMAGAAHFGAISSTHHGRKH